MLDLDLILNRYKQLAQHRLVSDNTAYECIQLQQAIQHKVQRMRNWNPKFMISDFCSENKSSWQQIKMYKII